MRAREHMGCGLLLVIYLVYRLLGQKGAVNKYIMEMKVRSFFLGGLTFFVPIQKVYTSGSIIRVV